MGSLFILEMLINSFGSQEALLIVLRGIAAISIRANYLFSLLAKKYSTSALSLMVILSFSKSVNSIVNGRFS